MIFRKCVVAIIFFSIWCFSVFFLYFTQVICYFFWVLDFYRIHRGLKVFVAQNHTRLLRFKLEPFQGIRIVLFCFITVVFMNFCSFYCNTDRQRMISLFGNKLNEWWRFWISWGIFRSFLILILIFVIFFC